MGNILVVDDERSIMMTGEPTLETASEFLRLDAVACRNRSAKQKF